jgi:hypothetical protein
VALEVAYAMRLGEGISKDYCDRYTTRLLFLSSAHIYLQPFPLSLSTAFTIMLAV